LQKRPIILRSLLIVATPYVFTLYAFVNARQVVVYVVVHTHIHIVLSHIQLAAAHIKLVAGHVEVVAAVTDARCINE